MSLCWIYILECLTSVGGLTRHIALTGVSMHHGSVVSSGGNKLCGSLYLSPLNFFFENKPRLNFEVGSNAIRSSERPLL